MNESKEMYLETILILNQEQEHTKAIDIAKAMDFSKPTVSVALKKLKNENLIHVDESSYITLTKEGQVIAEKILERHHVITNLLVSIGVTPEIAEKDACKIEHILSDETFDKIKKYFLSKEEN